MNAVTQPTADIATAQKALNKAKVALMTTPDSVFFITLCFSLKHGWDPDCPTAYTDGERIMFSPAFFMDLDRDEQVFLVLHETLHCAFLHMDRLNERDARKWNAAADYVINAILVERGFKMPAGGLYDPQYRGMSTEQVYNLLPSDPPAPPMDDLRAPPNKDSKQLKDQMDDILVRARTQAQMAGEGAGTIPGQIERYLDELLNPKLPWNRLLAKYFNSFAKTQYSFMRPNRRFFPKHILPSMHGVALGHVAVAIDTSASVTDERFKACVSELYPLVKKLKPKQLTLLQFDTRIKAEDEIHSLQDLRKVKFTGKGGTNIEPVMQWAASNKPDIFVVFTDGQFRQCDIKPASPLLWIIYDNQRFTAPYGKVIEFE